MSTANLPIDARPNVLRDQTMPNTLGGIGRPDPAPRLRPPAKPLAAAVAIAAAVAAFLVLRSA